MFSMFNVDKYQEKTIRKKVTKETDLITKRSAEIRDKIPKEIDLPILTEIKGEGSGLAEEGDSLLRRLNELRVLEKPTKKVQLKTIKSEAVQYYKDVALWDTKAITSLEMHEHGFLNMMMSQNNSASTSSSTINEAPYVHPANYWDCDLVDKINAAGKTPPVTARENRSQT
ncbi:hypothetical protein QCA50_019756 [Cerrena zonata]|uniref:Uncharacterized protein n=1 Tax=Cerrena zonata TaxID=2478898 RepID=A0AAW0FDZ3_9APHY